MQNNETRTNQVDLFINTDPYRHHIEKGQDKVFLHALCDALDVGVSILDENLNYKFIGDAVFKSLGIQTGELSVGDSLSHCHSLMMKNGLLTPDLLAENALSADEQKLRAEHGSEEIATIVRLGNGCIHKFTRKILPNGLTVSMSNDITEMVEKDDIIEKALELGNAGYWTYDFATKTYFLSQSLKKHLSETDLNRIDVHGILSIIHPDDRDIFRSALRSLTKTNDTFTVTCRTNTQDDTESWTTTTGQAIRDNAGKAVRMRAFVKDITEERKQSKELEYAKDKAIAASHAKSEFLANMSHEIRTPMNGILGMAELLANSQIDERQREFVDIINNSASSLLTIINDILDFSKIEAGAFEMDPVPFDLKASVNDVAAMLSSTAQEKGLEIIINYPVEAKTKFIGDGGRLRQVITNLLGNAIKFTEDGHIIINVDMSEPRHNLAFVTLNITDTGVGISQEKLPQIFNKFTQADNSTTRVFGGTGLGLSISRAIVELMDGRITAQSELGKGSTFTVRIPLAVDSNAIEKTFDTVSLRDKRALIVDDIAVNRSILTEQLASWEIKSDNAKDGVDALTQLKLQHANGQPYDFILMDFLMPGMDGHDLAKIVTSTAELAGTPIIMLSSCDQPISSKELHTIGIDNYLVKPVRENRLYEAILATLTNGQEAATQTKQPDIHLAPETAKKVKTEILVAEDFDLNQDVVRLMLADSDYQPVFVENGLEAVRLYKEDPNRFPLILMDVSMPVMDGHEATGLIKAYEDSQDLKTTPIIALTGHALKNDREECLDSGMSDYLTKPVKQSELLEKIAYWIDSETAQQAVA